MRHHRHFTHTLWQKSSHTHSVLITSHDDEKWNWIRCLCNKKERGSLCAFVYAYACTLGADGSVKRVFDKILMNQPVVLTSKPGSLEIKIQSQEILFKISVLKRKDTPENASFLLKSSRSWVPFLMRIHLFMCNFNFPIHIWPEK